MSSEDVAALQLIDRQQAMDCVNGHINLVWGLVDNLLVDPTLRQQVWDALRGTSDAVNVITAQLDEAGRVLRSASRLIEVMRRQNESLLGKLGELQTLERAVKTYDLNNPLVRDLVRDALDSSEDYAHLVQEMDEEDRLEWLRHKLMDVLGIGGESAAQIVHDIEMDRIPPDIAATIVEAFVSVAEVYSQPYYRMGA